MLLLTLVGVLVSLVQFALFAHLARRHRFATALLGLLATHTVIALGTQAVGIFTYPVILGTHAATILGLLYWIDMPKLSTWRSGLAKPWRHLKRADWLLSALLVLASLFLAFPHFNYSGLISHATEPEKTEVTNYVYTYPYFSDEWYSVALAQQSIADKGFPQAHPLIKDAPPLRDLEAPFHAIIAEFLLFFQLDPLRHFVILSLLINTMIISTLYLIGRTLGAVPIAAFVAAASALFITSAANLPGLWYLLPITLGVLPLLLSFVFLMSNQRWRYLIATFLALLYYPPLVVLIIPILLLQLIRNRSWLVTGAATLGVTAVAGALVFGIFATGSEQTVTELAGQIVGTLWYSSFTPNALPQYLIWNIVPGIMLLAGVVGLIQVRWRDRWLVAGILIGLGYWLVYHQNDSRFVIEYQRIIFVTALLLAALSSLGWHTVLSWLLTAAKKAAVSLPTLALSVAVMVVVLLLLPGYTQRDNWQQLILLDLATLDELPPSAPANDYLQASDLSAYRGVSEAHFLAPPWKGTVIGVATDNYPAATKGGTISINSRLFINFLRSDCAGRQQIARSSRLTHVYVPGFTCTGFEEVSQGSETLVLYSFTDTDS